MFQYYSLVESLYDTPFYWMMADSAYSEIAARNRGCFTEQFTAKRLTRVFGADKVFLNVDIWESSANKNKAGEIDVLVLLADRAIVVQAKSKKLTIAARKGNDLQLKEDFKAAVQDACDQAMHCSEELLKRTATFTDAKGNEIKIPASLSAIHPICAVSDHYPALSFQARRFIKSKATDVIKTALVGDVFLIDVLTEMLESPLRLLSYLELRSKAGNDVMHSHEIVALGYRLRRNLWLGDYDMLVLEDDISTDLDIAMSVRRLGLPGKRTPTGDSDSASGDLGWAHHWRDREAL